MTSNRRFEFAPTFSPDGATIAFNREAKDARIGVWLMATDGTARIQQTFGKLDFFPDWQPA